MSRLAGNTARAGAPTGATRRVATVAALCGVQFVDVLGVTVLVTALPRMLADLGATAAAGTVVVTAYAVFFGGLLMVASRIGDRVGHRRVVLGAMVLFAAASTLGALAGSVWWLAAARALQGVAAAASVPSALRLLTTVVPAGRIRRRAVAAWSAAGAAAGAAGFVVGGVLTELVSWRATFWVSVVLAVLLSAAVGRLVPRDPPPPPGVVIGWPSAAALTAGTMGVVAGTTLVGEHGAARVAGLVLTAAGALAVVGFALLERRAPHPLVVPAARRAAVLRWGAVGSFANTATTSSSFTVATFVLQDELGLTPLRAAALLVPFSVLVVVGSVVAPRLIRRLGANRAMGAGLGVIAAGNLLLVAWPQALGVGAAAGVCGIGIGVGSVAATDLGTSVDEAIAGIASGVLNTAAQLGTALGTSLVLLVATLLGAGTGWTIAAGLAAVAAAVVVRWAPSSGARR